jgi:inner membrane protein
VDNVTHTLAGFAIAEAAIALRRGPTGPAVARAAWLTGALASNAPDLDLLYTWITEAPYGYLLHHRGHTHTLLGAPLVALVALGGALGLAAWRKEPVPKTDRAWLFGVALLGALMHIVMDGANSFGVHPFWPVWNHWVAGDTLFILEPLLWIALAVPLARSATTRLGQRALLALVIGVLVLEPLSGMVSGLAMALSLVTTALLLVAANRLRTDGARAALALGAATFVVALFAAGRAVADERARTVHDGAFTHATEADVVLMPAPANPMCWFAISVAEEGGDVVLRRLQLSVLAIHPVGLCAMTFADETTALRVPIVRSETDAIRFVDEVRTPLAELRALARDCRGDAFLRFSRAPFVATRESGRWLGDLRYDREAGGSFAEALLEEGQACPELLPPWNPWRAELLEGTLPPEAHRHESLDF